MVILARGRSLPYSRSVNALIQSPSNVKNHARDLEMRR